MRIIAFLLISQLLFFLSTRQSAHGKATAPITERLHVGHSTPRAICLSDIDVPAADVDAR
jgi:hypothetical protein